MPKTPNFEQITDGITQADIEHFLRSAAPEDVKRQVKDSPDQRTKMRFVAGYLIRTNQVTAERAARSGVVKASAARKASGVNGTVKAARKSAKTIIG